MKIIQTKLPGVLVFEPKVFGDARGFFVETFHAERYRSAGVALDFVQDNLSFSRRGVLRGLHFQNPGQQGKLVHVLQGEVYDVAVDVRVGSPTFGQWFGVMLDGESKRQIWVPPGFAHGFCVMSETVLFAYKCTDLYYPQGECSVIWDDPDIGIEWPLKDPVLADKDSKGLRLKDIPRDRLPVFGKTPDAMKAKQ